ncbi:MAG TPA: Ig-like domain-containing protein, partial [Candidatus Polarisedimenticolia bacterium]|nr:Ig-like domain-containing protein [Candidatus Polarisedimenticolia bacterium]
MYFFIGRRSLRQVLGWSLFRQVLCLFVLFSLSPPMIAQVGLPGDLVILQPSDGATFKFGRPVDLEARAIGPHAPILRVDFYDGSNRIASSRPPEFRAVWPRPSAGEHTITAAAITSGGATLYSRFAASITIIPPNDDFSHAKVLSGRDIFIVGNNDGATSEKGEPIHAGTGNGHSVWWKWKAPASCDVTIEPASNSVAPVVAVYSGKTIESLFAVSSSATGSVSFSAVKGTIYHIAVDGSSGWTGSFALRMTPSTIRLTAPSPGAEFHTGDQIILTAITTPTDEKGASVDFFAASEFLGSAPRKDATFTWANSEPGAYSLVASITDRKGFVRRSEPVGIIVIPANDDFTNAYSLQGLSVSTNGNNVEATKEPGEPTGGDPSADASVWYSWTAPASGGVAVSIGENYYGGHPFGVYRGDSLSNLVSQGESIYGFYAVNFVAHRGEKYYVEVTGFSDEIPDGFGPFTVSVVQTPAPTNDDFADRIVLSGTSVSATGSNVAATVEPGEPGTSPSVWWTWTAPGTGSLFITTSNASLGATFSLFTGDSISNLQFVASVGPSWYDGTDASGEVHVVEGETYQIMLTGTYVHPVGSVAFNLTFEPAPPNDNFTNAYPLVGLAAVSSSSNTTASIETGETNSNGRTVWWTWTAPVSGPVSLGTAGSSFQPWLAVYTGSEITNLSLITNHLSNLQLNAVAGTTYQISVDANGGGQIGQIQLTLVAGFPSNDNFTNRISLSGTNFTVNASTVGATSELGEPVHGGFQGSNSIWYTWTPTAPGTVTIQVTGDGFNPTWAVYTGSALGSLSDVVDSYTWPWNIRSSASFAVQPGIPLQIAVDGSAQVGGRSVGLLYLNLSFVGLPTNDNFANRTVINGTSVHVSGDTSGATVETGEPQHGGYPGAHSIWWSWTAPTSGYVTLDAFGSAADTIAGVYTGNALTNLTAVASGTPWFSAMQFQCDAGVTYQIALDSGYYGTYGAVNLNLVFSSVRLTSPTNDSVFHAPAEILLLATNTVWDGTFTQMDFLSDGNIIGSATSLPYRFAWTNPPFGNHQLQARITDATGVTRFSPPVAVHVRPA